jgi:ATP-dependent helicase/nuclease subunit A
MTTLDLTGPRPRIDLAAVSPPLTVDQRAAMALDRELFVTAGAGAGKTHVLSLRYVALLLELAVDAASAPGVPRPDIESVLVLTFTEKAAEEMTARCYRRLLELAEAVRAQHDALDRRWPGAGRRLGVAVGHLVEAFGAARISTFHAFCARLLRELPAEAGVRPGFEVLEEAEAAAWAQQASEEALEAHVARAPADLAWLLQGFGGRSALLEAAATAVSERGRLASVLQAHADRKVDAQTLLRGASVSPGEALRWLRQTGRPRLDDVAIALAAGPVPPAEVNRVRAALAALPDTPPSDAGALDLYALYARTLSTLLTDDGSRVRGLSHPTFLGARAAWPDGRAYTFAKAALDAIADASRDWPARWAAARELPTRVDVAMLEVLTPFSQIVRDALTRLRARFAHRGAVDFAELQVCAIRAVSSEGVLDLLRRRHRYVMVDEFQDTDAAQWQIVSRIGRCPGAPADRIFVVGDVKQAIYGFRGGDVTLFADAPAVGLAANFRSRPELIGWFNAFFGTVLGPARADRPAFEASYEPLGAARDAPGGTVTLLVQPATAAGADAVREAEAVARLCAAELLSGRGAFAELLDRDRHPLPPVAVLLRSRTRLGLFEAALRRHGVSYVVAKGVGFWERAEVLDLVNALSALATGDPIALVGVLRSPLLCVPDQEIHDLVTGRHTPEGVDPLASFGSAPLREAPPSLARAARLFGGWRDVRDRLPVAGLLREILSRATGWHAHALSDPQGQATANARRLVTLAERFDARGLGLREATRSLHAQAWRGVRESEATLGPTEARVVLMTVHAAKGLEFPVVIAPELGARPDASPSPLAIGRVGGEAAIACRAPDPDARIRRTARPGRFAALERVRAEEEAAEQRRLLYVAVTRAEDHLVLVGSLSAKAAATPVTWMDLVRAHHGETPVDRDGLRVRAIADVLALEPPPRPPPPPPPPPTAADARRIAAVPGLVEIEVSPSGLDVYEACPARWYRRYRLQVPETGDVEAPERAALLAGLRGQVVHSLLEDDRPEDEELARVRFEAQALGIGATEDEVGAGLATLREHLETAAQDPWLAAVLAAPGFSEVPFRIASRASATGVQVVLKGQIDRLWFDAAADTWVVLDYKSEIVRGPIEAAAARHERQLFAYAEAAERVLRGHGQRGVDRGELYFTDRGAVVAFGPWDAADRRRFEARLHDLGETANRGWATVEAEATSGDVARPCARCGYWARGCRGATSVP